MGGSPGCGGLFSPLSLLTEPGRRRDGAAPPAGADACCRPLPGAGCRAPSPPSAGPRSPPTSSGRPVPPAPGWPPGPVPGERPPLRAARSPRSVVPHTRRAASAGAPHGPEAPLAVSPIAAPPGAGPSAGLPQAGCGGSGPGRAELLRGTQGEHSGLRSKTNFLGTCSEAHFEFKSLTVPTDPAAQHLLRTRLRQRQPLSTCF